MEMGEFNIMALVSMVMPIGLALIVLSQSEFSWKFCLRV